MATEAQIKANQLNAMRSTGPRTEAGKKITCRNSITHGLTARNVLLEGEDPAYFEYIQKQLVLEWNPLTQVDRELVEKLACDFWRLRRIPVFEAAMKEWIAHREVRAGCPGSVDLLMPCDQGPHSTLPAKNSHITGRTIEAVFLKGDLLAKLARHEAHLFRQVEKTLSMLRSLKKEPPCKAIIESDLDDKEVLF